MPSDKSGRALMKHTSTPLMNEQGDRTPNHLLDTFANGCSCPCSPLLPICSCWLRVQRSLAGCCHCNVVWTSSEHLGCLLLDARILCGGPEAALQALLPHAGFRLSDGCGQRSWRAYYHE